MKRSWGVAVAALVCLALAAAGVLVLRDTDEVAPGADEQRIYAWSVSEADRVVVRGPGSAWRLDRRDGVWHVDVRGTQGVAKEGILHDLLDSLEAAGWAIPLPNLDPLEAGFERPYRVWFVVDGAEQWIDVGDPSPVGSRSYVRLPDGRIFGARGALGEEIRRDPLGLIAEP